MAGKKKLRIGVLGAYRGTSMISYCDASDNAEVVAICDKWPEALQRQKDNYSDRNIAFYDNFDDFIKHDMDAVWLANYAHEHAPFAIKALKAGKHVASEVLPVQTPAEAVELVETIEETGLTYAYAENYVYMPGPYEMKKRLKEGQIGEVEYAECEYVHNCESIWPSIAYGDKNHWRNRMYCTFYCTHSLGPIIFSTGLRPVKVTGFEGKMGARAARMGKLAPAYGMEIVELNNGAHIKSLHGGLYKHNTWYSIYGSKGRLETARASAGTGSYTRLYAEYDPFEGDYNNPKREDVVPVIDNEASKAFGHGGSDFFSAWNFVEKVKGNPNAETIDIYMALDMCMCGVFAYRSILAGGIPMEVPNFRDKATREKYRNDRKSVFADKNSADFIPPNSQGVTEYPDEVYAEQKRLFEADLKSTTGYSNMAFNQSRKTAKKKIEV